jgi:putative ABC transport system permease protein
MFDLKKALSEWKRSLRKFESFEDGAIAELESHLLDEFDRQRQNGLADEEAFARAAAAVGRPEDVGGEYFKDSRRSHFFPALIVNYMKVARRAMKRQKAFALINLAGLAVGMASCILIMLWVKDELSFDRHFEKADRIYRLTYSEEIGGVSTRMAKAPFAAAPAFLAEIPGVEAYIRLTRTMPLVIAAGRKFDETDAYYVDGDYFKIFNHHFIAGDPHTALSAPGTVVLTEETSRRLFGHRNALGKTLNINHRLDLRVTGIIRNNPSNSHFKFNYLISYSTLASIPAVSENFKSWFNVNGWCYILLDEKADAASITKKMATVAEKYAGAEARAGGTKQAFQLQKLTDIHLKSHLIDEIGANGDIRDIIIFSIIAVFILVIACINFMNLSTARSLKRSKEVGLRKVLGADRKNLAIQFLGESVFMSMLSLASAIALVIAVLPAFNRITEKNLGIAAIWDGSSWLGLAGLVIFTSLVSGSYPAFFLSRFLPVIVLKNNLSQGMKRSSFRSVLVVLQFSISVILMASTFILIKQVHYMKNQELGFAQNQLLVVRIKESSLRKNLERIKRELLQNPDILDVSASDGVPGNVQYSLTLNRQGQSQNISHSVDVIYSDYDFSKTYGIKIQRGRDFSKAYASDAQGVFLINEMAAQIIGIEADAVGRRIGFASDQMKEIVGVMKDFHYQSLRDKIGPLVVLLAPGTMASWGNYLSMKIRARNIPRTVGFVKDLFATKSEREFDYFFVDENFNALYRNEKRLGMLISVFAAMAIFVACLGLFGLASYATEQRSREIGIRKVLGASEAGIIYMLSKGFAKQLILANLLAWPIAYYFMAAWLRDFAYKISLGWTPFLAAGIFSLIIAMVTAGFQAVKAARMNPTKSLSCE